MGVYILRPHAAGILYPPPPPLLYTPRPLGGYFSGVGGWGVYKIRPRNSGAGSGCANFMGAWKNAFFLQEKKSPCP